jgi:hypothetical protein
MVQRERCQDECPSIVVSTVSRPGTHNSWYERMIDRFADARIAAATHVAVSTLRMKDANIEILDR